MERVIIDESIEVWRRTFSKAASAYEAEVSFYEWKYLYFLEKDWNGPYENVPYDFSFQGSLQGIPILIEKNIPFGEIVFGIE